MHDDGDAEQRGPYIHWREMPGDVRRHMISVWSTIALGAVVFVMFVLGVGRSSVANAVAIGAPTSIVAAVGVRLLAMRWRRSRKRRGSDPVP